MKRILTAVVLIPLVLLIVFLGPSWLVTLAVAAVAALAGWEYLGLAEHAGAKPSRIAVVVAIVALITARLAVETFEWLHRTEIVFGILGLALLLYCTFRSPVERVMADASTAIFCLLYVGLTFTALPALREESNGPSLLLFLLCVVWAGDIAALYIGRAWGRHKLAPTLSPNKSWEGAVGSLAGSLLATGGLLALATWVASLNSARLSYPEETWYWMVLAVLVNVAAQVGDLAESALKRSVGVKDSGTLLPGHGGVLDRIDALLLAAPVLWYAQIIHQRF
ncbi:MAG: phosphatidate cytidylyltransferase [Terracidiphilus sp.]|jgi:phosphatidate cytidylyltransferase